VALESTGSMHMNLEDFPLAWSWTQSSHAKLPDNILCELHPYDIESAQLLAASRLTHFPAGATRHNSSVADEPVKDWLKQLAISSQRVTILWDQNTALNLPWSVFCDYWDDFCYPSSDDADLFLESGQLFLRWNHYEVFEHDPSAI
jgi:hypothetical protein